MDCVWALGTGVAGSLGRRAAGLPAPPCQVLRWADPTLPRGCVTRWLLPAWLVLQGCGLGASVSGSTCPLAGPPHIPTMPWAPRHAEPPWSSDWSCCGYPPACSPPPAPGCSETHAVHIHGSHRHVFARRAVNSGHAVLLDPCSHVDLGLGQPLGVARGVQRSGCG